MGTTACQRPLETDLAEWFVVVVQQGLRRRQHVDPVKTNEVLRAQRKGLADRGDVTLGIGGGDIEGVLLPGFKSGEHPWDFRLPSIGKLGETQIQSIIYRASAQRHPSDHRRGIIVIGHQHPQILDRLNLCGDDRILVFHLEGWLRLIRVD
ncbi:hypothetical protein D3C86_1680280 [compost metagenome]